MRRVWRAATAVALLLGIYLLAAGVLLAVVGLAVLAVRHRYPDALVGQLVGLAFVTAVGLVAGLRRRLQVEEELPGVVLEDGSHPRLWREVRALSNTVGTRPPDEIRLVPEVNAAVWEQIRVLGLVPGRRILFLGAPIVMGLTSQQLRSVLAHELGHYSHRHTALGGITVRGREALTGVVDRFGERSLVGRLFRAYADIYLSLTASLHRQLELEADDLAVEVGGRDAAAAALSEIPVLHAAWEHYFEEFVDRVHASGKRPTELFEGFQQVLDAPRLQEALASFRTDFDDGAVSSFDSHPPLSERISRVASLPPDGVPQSPAPALALLDKPKRDLVDLQEWMYRATLLHPAPWSALLDGHEPAEVRSRAQVLYRAAQEAEHAQISLGTVVGSVRGRQLARWVRPHLAVASGEHIRATSAELVTSAVDEALMSVAGARQRLAWDEAPRLVAPSGSELDSRPVVDRALEAGDPAILASWLAKWGVGLDYVPTFPEVDPREQHRRAPLQVLEALAPIGGGHLFLVVLNHGVLLRRGHLTDHLAWLTGGTSPGRVLLRRVLGVPATHLVAEQGSTWLRWEQIMSVTVGRARFGRPTLTFTGTDGSTWTVRYRLHTRDSGDALATLGFFLQDRVVGRFVD